MEKLLQKTLLKKFYHLQRIINSQLHIQNKRKMKLSLLTSYLLCSLVIYSQQTTFELLLDTENDQILFDAMEDEYGNFYTVGYSSEPGSGFRKGLLIKFDNNGNILDENFYPLLNDAYTISNIIQDTSGTFILCGFTTDTTANRLHLKLYMQRIDYSLSTLKQKTYDISKEHRTAALFSTLGFNNDILITTGIFKDTQPPALVYNIRLNSNLDSVYASKQFLGLYSSAIHQLTDSTYWVFGDPNGRYMICDTMFNILQIYNTSFFVNEPLGIKWDTDTSFFMAGEWGGGPDDDIGILRQYHPHDTTNALFTSWGTLDTLDMTALTGALDFKNKDSVYVGAITPFWINWPSFPSCFVLLQTDSLLNIRWERFYCNDEYYYDLMNVLATKDGGCLLVGNRYDYNAEIKERDIYILKVNDEGLIVNTNEPFNIKVSEAIVFPNPGTNRLNLRIAEQHPKSIFELYDMKGRLVIHKKVTGKWSEINTTLLKSGTYIYKIYNKTGLNEKGKWIKN
jgi:hypothetical protein